MSNKMKWLFQQNVHNIAVVLFIYSNLSLNHCHIDLNQFGLELDTQQQSLGKCIVAIGRKTFISNTLTMIYEDGSFNKNHYTIYRALFSIGVAIQHILASHLMDNQEQLCDNAYSGNLLLVIRNHTQFELIFRKFRDCNAWSFDRKIIVLVPLFGKDDQKKRILLIDTILDLHFVNFLAMIQNDQVEDRYDFVSGYSYSSGMCDRSNHSEIAALDSCVNGVLYNGNVEHFPKVAQLNRCPLRIGTVVYAPYIQAKREGEGENVTDVIVGGLEVLFMNEMSRIMNFSVVYVTDEKKQNWGDVYPNGTITGLFKMLIDRRADLVMGSLSASVHRSARFNGLYSFFLDSETYCVPYSDPLPEWLKMVNVIQFSVIITIVILIIIMAILVRRIFVMYQTADTLNRCNHKYGRRISAYDRDICYDKDPLLILLLLISTTLTIPVRRFPRNDRVRALFALWFLLSINIDTGFRTGFMASLSMDDHKPQLKSFEEILERNYTVYLPEYQLNNYKENEHPSLMRLWRLCQDTIWCLDQVAYGQNSALAISTKFATGIFKRYIPPGHDHPIIYCLPNVTVTLPTHIFTIPGFALTQSFNEAIQKLSSSGFIELWYRQSFPMFKFSKPVAETDEHQEIRLTFEHLQAMFVLMGVLYSLATVLIFFEMCYFKWKRP